MPALHITADPDADALLTETPLALLIGMLLDQQVAMETAFAGPLKIAQRIGTVDAAAIAAYDPDEFVEVFRPDPVGAPLPGLDGRRASRRSAPRSIEEWGGDAAAIWTQGDPDGPEVLRRLEGAARLRRAEGEDLPRPAGQAVRVHRRRLARGIRSLRRGGSLRSVADIRRPESLAKVREHKRAMKAAAKDAAR